MTVETYGCRRKTKLSTDRYKTSSESHPIFALAYCALFALANCRTCISQQDLSPPKQTVGERLAADLTWTQAERDERFAHMDRLFPVHTVERGGKGHPLLRGPRLGMDQAITRYMQAEHLAGVLVLQHGRVRAERYAL